MNPITRAVKTHRVPGSGFRVSGNSRSVLPFRNPDPGTRNPAVRPRGVAIIMVIVILAGLIALAAPFVFSMLLHGRSARSGVHSAQAKLAAEGALAVAVSRLQEQTLRYDPRDTTPEVTRLTDLRIAMEFPLAADQFNRLDLKMDDPRGALWSAKAEDEQGKINLNTAPPALLTNLMLVAMNVEDTARAARLADYKFAESGVLVDECETGDEVILVRQWPTSLPFASDGKPETEDGAVTIENDRIRYKDVRPVGGRDVELVLVSTPRKHDKGRFVCKFHPFKSIYEIKSSAVYAPDEFARIQPYLTIQSGLDGPTWGRSEPPTEQAFTGTLESFEVENGDGFGPGTLIRIMQNGIPLGYARVGSVTVPPAQPGGPTPKPRVNLTAPIGITATGGGGTSLIYIEPELKHPININTATPEVIAACIVGLAFSSDSGNSGQSGNQPISLGVAFELANYLLSPPGKSKKSPVYSTHEDLYKALDAAAEMGIISIRQRDAVYVNATEPNTIKLTKPTVTFCYHSFGSYTVEASGVANSDTGFQQARHTLRQLVSLPTPYPGRFKIEHQAGFQYLLDQGMGARVVTYPIPMGLFKNERNNPKLRRPDLTKGDIRLDIGGSTEEFPWPTATKQLWEPCENEKDSRYRQDGYDLNKGQAFTAGTVAANGNGNAAASLPTSVEMWFRPTGGNTYTFFDEGIEDEKDRVSFTYESSKGLVIRIHDSSLEERNKDGVEFIYPIELKKNNWYHIAGSWKHSHPNGQEIRVDGNLFPQAGPKELKFGPGARLSGGLGLNDDGPSATIELEDVTNDDDFPDAGAVKIGEEIIEYRKRSGTTLRELRRGTRNSATAKHNSGEWVYPYGFKVDIAQDLTIGGGTLTERIEPERQTRTRVVIPPLQKPPLVIHTETGKIPVDDTTGFPPSGFITVEGECIYYGKKTATAFQQLQRAQGSGRNRTPARNLHNGAGIRLASIEINNSNDYDPQGIVQIDDEDNEKLVEWISHDDKQVMNGKHYLTAVLEHGGPGYRTGFPEVSNINGPNIHIHRFRGAGFWDAELAEDQVKRGLDPNGPREAGNFKIRPQTAHSKKAKVIPVIRIAGPHCGGFYPVENKKWNTEDEVQISVNKTLDYGLPLYGEKVSPVTLHDRDANVSELRWIKQAYIGQQPVSRSTNPPFYCPRVFVAWEFNYFIGLDDFVKHRFQQGRCSVLKWPTGELPHARGATRYVASGKGGENQLSGHVDEVKVGTHRDVYGGRIAMTTDGKGIDPEEDTIRVEVYNAWPNLNRGGNVRTPNQNQTLPMAWPSNGLIRIEDELMYYSSVSATSFQYYVDVFAPLENTPPELNKADRNWINPCTRQHEQHLSLSNRNGLLLSGIKRGVLGTKAKDHPVGANIMLFDAFPVSQLSGNMSGGSDQFTLTNGRGFPEEGYAWIGDKDSGQEVVSYLKRQGNLFTGTKYFRGRFGTEEADHDATKIVRCLPFRHWDRDSEFYDGKGLAFIQGGYAASDAKWRGVAMKIVGTEEYAKPANVEPRVLVRFDGRPGWDATPTNEEGGLYEFSYANFRGAGDSADDEIRASIRGGSSGLGLPADQMEVRVFWKYKQAAFNSGYGEDWKKTFSIERMRGIYTSPLIMRRIEEVEKR